MYRKWLIILVSLVIILFYNSVIKKQSLFQRAIVVGLGVDENSITIQYIKDDKYLIYNLECKSIDEVEDKIYKSIGLKASFAQCVVLILGEKVNTESYFCEINNKKNLSNNLIIVRAESPKIVLSTIVEGSECTSFLIETIMKNDPNKFTLKDYYISTVENKEIDIPLIGINENGIFRM